MNYIDVFVSTCNDDNDDCDKDDDDDVALYCFDTENIFFCSLYKTIIENWQIYSLRPLQKEPITQRESIFSAKPIFQPFFQNK